MTSPTRVRTLGAILYPEFELIRRMLASAGIDTVIADAAALSFTGGRLMHDGMPVDLVYNRLVELARQDVNLTECHSIEEAAVRHKAKHGRRKTVKDRERPTTAIEEAAAETGRDLPMPQGCESEPARR